MRRFWIRHLLPDGQLTVAFDVSLAPSFLEPAETPGIGTPFRSCPL